MGNPRRYEIPKRIMQNEESVLSRTKEKERGTSKGRKTIHRKMEKSKCSVNKCSLGFKETMGPREEF